MPMNRRGFLKAMISAAGAVAAAPYVPAIIREPVSRLRDTMRMNYAQALAASMIKTKEVVAANVLNHAFGDPDAKDV